VLKPEDLSRDILKSESCALSSPELNLSVTPGTMGGRFTTVEGLLTQVRDDLRSQIFDVGRGADSQAGDSLPAEEKKSWDDFFEGLNKAIKADMEYTLVLEDPLAASYVQSLCVPAPDPQITTEDYERTEEENEDLGLNDMKVEGYGVDEVGAGQDEVHQDQAKGRSDHDI
jgi:zinc finger protein